MGMVHRIGRMARQMYELTYLDAVTPEVGAELVFGDASNLDVPRHTGNAKKLNYLNGAARAWNAETWHRTLKYKGFSSSISMNDQATSIRLRAKSVPVE